MMSGFGLELFVDPIDPEFICSVCHGVYNLPVTCEDGHTFCRVCIEQWLATRNTCPVDRSVMLRAVIRNRAVEGAIKKKLLKCPSTATAAGCHWTGPLSSLDQHLTDCPMNVVECPFKARGCILRTYKGELDSHLLVCPYRTEKCPSCSLDIAPTEVESHGFHCAARKVPCVNGCGVDVERCKMLSHLAFVCIKEGRACPLYALGCGEVHSAGSADPAVHLNLLMKARLSEICEGTTVPPSGVHLGASWTIEDDDFPICSPLFEGAVARARVELLSSHGSISVKLHMESKEKLQSYCVDLRCCLRCGDAKVKFHTAVLPCQFDIVSVDIPNVCPEDTLKQFISSINVLFFDFMLTLSV